MTTATDRLQIRFAVSSQYPGVTLEQVEFTAIWLIMSMTELPLGDFFGREGVRLVYDLEGIHFQLPDRREIVVNRNKRQMLQVTRTGLIRPSDESISAMCRQFQEQQSLHLIGFIDLSLLENVMTGLETAIFHETQHLDSKNRQFAKDHTIDGRHVVTHIFHLILNSPLLFEVIQQIT